MPSNIKAKKDYYKILDLSAGATDDDIRAAYKKLVGLGFMFNVLKDTDCI